MPRASTVQSNFSAGEVSPLLLGRTDYQRYQAGALALENFVVLLQGGIEKRHGTRYVATAKTGGSATRLAPFIFRNVDALVLEFGNLYVRFYKNGAQLEVAGVPVEVVTPYLAADVFDLRLTQKNDVVFITHQGYAPRKLQRLSDTSWQLSTANAFPPPTTEAGIKPAVAITLGALTGDGVTVTAGSAIFLASDVDREIVAGAGRGAIASFSSTTVVTLNIVDDFSSVNVAAGAWTIGGSPVAEAKPSKAGPQGGAVTLSLRKIQDNAPELVTNGDFASGLTGWTNYSAALVASGTHTGGLASSILIDSSQDFVAAGVLSTHTLSNTTDASDGPVSVVSTTQVTATLTGGTDNLWDTGDAYQIRQTGSASGTTFSGTLSGGTAGIGWIEQAIATVAGQIYRIEFDVSGSSLSCQVGSSAQGSDLAAEASFMAGANREVVFTATGATSYLQFRNNQNLSSGVDNVSCKIFGIDGWRPADAGKYVYLNSGLVKITAYTSAQVVSGQIVENLSTDDSSPGGGWTLESEAWNATDGYPALSIFHEQRWLPMSSPGFPQTVWGSRSGDFENFTRGTTADSAFSYTLAEAEGLIEWALSAEQLLIGAENGEYRMVGDGDGPISAAAPPLVRPIGNAGSAQIEPIRIGIAALFLQRQGSKLRELIFTQAVQTYESADRSILSGHLLATARVIQMAYSREPVPIVWMPRNDGVLLGLTYERQEQILAWHRQTMGGGGAVESVAVIPHPTLNAHQVWLVVRRMIGGSTTRYIEVLDDTAYGVDSAAVYDGTATSTLSGLAHLEGQTVRIAGIPSAGSHWAVFPSQVVSGGAVTLSVPCTQAYAGLGYDAEAETLPLELPNTPTLQADLKRWVRLVTRVYQTGEGLVLQGKPVSFRRAGVALLNDGVPLFTGKIKPMANLGADREGTITVTHNTPLPCTILMVGGKLESGED